jgi:hypothetical protein
MFSVALSVAPKRGALAHRKVSRPVVPGLSSSKQL